MTVFALSAASIFVPNFLMDIFQGGISNKILSLLSVSTARTPNLMFKLAYDGFFKNFWVEGLFIVMARLALTLLCLYLAYSTVRKTRK